MNRKTLFRRVKDVRDFIGRKPWTLKPGEPVKELQRAQDAMLLWYLAIGDLLEWDPAMWDKRKAYAWLGTVRKYGLVQVNDYFKDVDLALCKSFTLGEFRSRISSYPSSYWILLEPFKPWIFAFFSYDLENKYGSLSKLRIALLFISHLTLSGTYSRKQYDKWFANQERLKGVNSTPSQWLKERIRELDLPSPWQCFCQHGNGSVSELRRVKNSDGKFARIPLTEVDKWSLIGTDRVKFYLRRCGVIMLPEWKPRQGLENNNFSRLTDVPKGLGEVRIISPEPTDRMFIQQSLKAILYDWVEDSPWKYHIPLTMQVASRVLSLVGSISGRYATVDLSSASDSILWTWVRDLFEYRRDWRMAFELACTKVTRYKRQLIGIEHFAPMGSGICFIMLSIVCALLVEEAITLSGGDPSQECWLVYGDDIAIPDYAIPVLYHLLLNAGLQINTNKSFTSSDPNFREACGGHWYCGTDVAPIRLSRKFLGLSDSSAENLLKLTSLCNMSFGVLPSVRATVISSLADKGYHLPFSNDIEDSSKIFTVGDCWSIETRREKDRGHNKPYYFSTEARITAPILPQQSRRPKDEQYAYFKWMLERDKASNRAQLYPLVTNETAMLHKLQTSKLGTKWSASSLPTGAHSCTTEDFSLVVNGYLV